MARRVAQRALLLPALALALAATLPAALASSLVWQGFSHRWLREVAGFETPHRLGSFANLFTTSTLPGAALNVTFTPGVDGDFAFPTAFASAVSNSSGVLFQDDAVVLQFTDTATQSDAPVANTTLARRVAFRAPPSPATEVAVVVVRGVRLDMHCDPALQPPGAECNSNGVWPVRLDLAVSNCSSAAVCALQFQLVRGWTPTHGGGKPFNYRMSFNVTVLVSVLSAAPDALRGTQLAPRAFSSSIRDPPRTVQDTAQGVGGDRFASATLGLSGFGFELTGEDDDRGRYLEHLQISASPASYDARNGTLAFSRVMSYRAPLTVHQATATLWLYPALLQFAGHDLVAPHAPVNGSVCFSAVRDGFSCALHHLPDSCSDSVLLD